MPTNRVNLHEFGAILRCQHVAFGEIVEHIHTDDVVRSLTGQHRQHPFDISTITIIIFDNHGIDTTGGIDVGFAHRSSQDVVAVIPFEVQHGHDWFGAREQIKKHGYFPLSVE